MANATPWETTDLGSAAFALSRGLVIRGVNRREGRDVVFSFDDPEGKGPGLMIAYANSSERKYDEAVRTLKKLAPEFTRRRT